MPSQSAKVYDIQVRSDHGPVIIPLRKTKDWSKDGFIMLARSLARYLASAEGLGAKDLQVALALMSLMDYENVVACSMSEVAEIANMPPQNVSRSMKKLEKANLIRHERMGKFKLVGINPYAAARGRSKTVQDLRKKWDDGSYGIGEEGFFPWEWEK